MAPRYGRREYFEVIRLLDQRRITYAGYGPLVMVIRGQVEWDFRSC